MSLECVPKDVDNPRQDAEKEPRKYLPRPNAFFLNMVTAVSVCRATVNPSEVYLVTVASNSVLSFTVIVFVFVATVVLQVSAESAPGGAEPLRTFVAVL